MSPPPNTNYSVREIINRYESEEDEFLRELEDMRQSIQTSEQDEDIPQDPAPILSVLCSLVDEIGSLRTENRHLKTRLTPTPNRAKNMVQRLSGIFDSHSHLIPKLRRPSANSEVRTGARERLSTPPRKELTASTISTDFSVESRSRAPPLVEPELSDSDVDDNIFLEDQSTYERRGRRENTRRCEMSMSEYTSPSSASSSRDPSEAMTSSRSSFFEMFGFKKRNPTNPIAHLPPKSNVKKRRKRASQDDVSDIRNHQMVLNSRPSSYYPREDSEDSDHMRTRKTSSFLSVNRQFNSNDGLLRVDRETRLRHEKQNLEAEIEELKTRNQRLVDQLREKSGQNSKLQVSINRMEQQLDHLVKRCSMNESLEKMTAEERLYRTPREFMEKVEEVLRKVENRMQNIKIETANQNQMTMSFTKQERNAHQICLDQLEKLQRENFSLLNERYNECGSMDPVIRRKMDALPSYEALYAFTSGVVRKLSELRWNLLDKTNEANKAEMELISCQSSLLVTHAQIERLRIGWKETKKKRKRPASYHGEVYGERMDKSRLNFYLPFKLHGNRIDNVRRNQMRRSEEIPDKSIEEEFLALFGSSREKQQMRPVSRIEMMMREMSGGRQKHKTYSPVLGRMETPVRTERRPISLVELEDDLKLRRFEDSRRSIKHQRESNDGQNNRDFRCVVSSLQDVNAVRSPTSTPLATRRNYFDKRPPSRLYDPVSDAVPRVRKLERGFSSESRYEDRGYNREEIVRLREDMTKEREERKRQEEAIRKPRLQRSQPVQISRIRPPTNISNTPMKTRTLEPTQRSESIKYERSRTLDNNDSCSPKDNHMTSNDQIPSKLQKPARSWLEKIRNMKRT